MVGMMPELVSIQNMSTDLKIALLDRLGYNSDGTFVLDRKGRKVTDIYTGDPIKLNNMFIFPGSIIILDNNPLSISSFMEEYGDNF